MDAADARATAGGLPSAALAADPEDELDIDTRIGLVEQQLIGREQRLAHRAQSLSQRVSRVAAPQAWLWKGGSAAVAGAAALWALNRGMRRPASTAAAAGTPDAAAAPVGGAPHLLLSLLPMAWPLLPSRWRSRMSPATAATVLGIAVPLVQRVLARRPAAASQRKTPSASAAADGRTESAAETAADAAAKAAKRARSGPLPTVAQLNPLRFAGTWYEQARLPQPFEAFCHGQPRAIYTPQGARLGVRNECRLANGRLVGSNGMARVVPGSGGARLRVTFAPAWLRWLPFVWADLWVLHVDDAASNYRVALAGHPTRLGLWLLSRTPHLPADEMQRLLTRARELGFNTDRLTYVTPGRG